MADAEPVGDAGSHVLHEDVPARRERLDDRAALRRLEVQRDRALAAVPAEEAGELAEAVAFERLDLDHVGAHVGQKRAA